MTEIKFGDIIYVKRDCGIFGYKHFGVYSGDNKVIHYTKDGGDLLDGVICETSLKKFLDGDTDCYAIDFDNFGRRIGDHKVPLSTAAIGSSIGGIMITKILFEFIDLFFSERKLYSPEETVQRAREHTKPGKNRGYDLLVHNCEHFAIWCKTGIAESEQIQELIEAFIDIAVKIPVKNGRI